MRVNLITKMGRRISASKRDARLLTMLGRATVVEDPAPVVEPEPVAPEPEVIEPPRRVYRRRNMVAASSEPTYGTREVKDESEE